MDQTESELLARLLPTFRAEAEEHLRHMTSLLSALEKEPSPAALEEAFREIHSLKGAARTVSARELESLCQEMEAVFAALRKEEIRLDRPLLDLLMLAADLAADMAREAGTDLPVEMSALSAEAGRRLGEASRGKRAEVPPPLPRQMAEAAIESTSTRLGLETLRVGAQRLEKVLVQAEELLTDRLNLGRTVDELRELSRGLEKLRRNLLLLGQEGRSLQRSRLFTGAGAEEKNFRRLVALMEEGEETAANLNVMGKEILRDGEAQYRSVSQKVDHLLNGVRETLMLPVATLLEQFPRIVRDLARESGKAIDLETAGGEVPLDRRILEELRDPLLHLLRNAIDHGIEPAEERARTGKPPRGRIVLEVTSPSPRRVLFTVRDDGRGLDTSALKEAAIREGLLTAEGAEALGKDGLNALAFAPGLSTTERVTTVSGRGLGLSIAREKVEQLGGAVEVSSRKGDGTTFRLEIPASLAAFRGVLVRLGESRYIFPAPDVEQVLRVPRELLAVAENRNMIELEKVPLPVIHLREPLELPLPSGPSPETLHLVVIASRRGRAAFVVDEILSEQEFLVKSLGRQLVKVRNLLGAVILGDGGVALILDPDDLVRSSSRTAPAVSEKVEEIREPARKRVLVVEDSITSRTLLRNILEGAGYAVTTAVDGIDAVQRLGTAVFDVVVSDVEMPRMDGFALTRKIREMYGRLPVILVTGLENPEDRERGMRAGADAYLVKSRFDQANLLEAVGRLA